MRSLGVLSLVGAIGVAVLLASSPGTTDHVQPFSLEDGATPADVGRMRDLAAGRRGYVVWESRRPSGTLNLKYRVWKRNLDGSGLAMISGAPGEPNYAHLGPRISPDGRHVVFAGSRWNSARDPGTKTLWDDEYVAAPFDAWVIDVDPVTLQPQPPRELSALHGRVGTAGEDHVFEWKDSDTLLVSLPDSKGIFEFDIAREVLGRLVVGDVNAELQASPDESIVFSSAGAGASWGRIRTGPDGSPVPGQTTALGGCEVTVSKAGDCLVWRSRDGPKLSRFSVRTGESGDVVGVVESLPPDHNYVYFPALSWDGTMLAVGGSGYARDDIKMRHSHAYADYEIFLAPWDPQTCAPIGPPVRYTFNDRSRYPGVDERAGHVLDRWPDVWVEPAVGTEAESRASEPGARPHVESAILSNLAAQVSAATRYGPILDQLATIESEPAVERSREAKRIREAIETWASASLARAKRFEETSPGEAVSAYRDLQRGFSGRPWGLIARERLTQLGTRQRIESELRAWSTLDALRRAELLLQDVPGAARSAEDPRFARRNTKTLRKMQAIAEHLQADHPATRANALAGGVLATYRLKRTSASDRIVAVVDAVVTRTSDPQGLLADKQYPEGLVCTEYRVQRIVSGSVDGDRLITLQLARKGDELLEAARFKIGDAKRLTLGLWDAQTAYHQHKIADDINDVDSTVYFVFTAAPQS
jgi:hypothetical protein